MLELLAPAGSPQAVIAAVQSGADAVYLGYGDFNARRNAKNFTDQEVAQVVSYCHVRGVRVFLTLNTLLTDRELPKAAELAAQASDLGIDAVIAQDLGVVRMLRQTVPDLPIHGSTQMSIHSLDGVKQCADLGMERVVVSRELSRAQLEHICIHAPIEIETFVHGALCMCYSGQCFFSSVIGGRSGNRGLCAQPCRLKYGWGSKADGYPLSLKDLSLAGHLKELRKLGISCLKIEGRMKRPEYVAIVTSIYAKALQEDREPTAQALEQLEAAFSRQGFTDGYFTANKGGHMFGVRQEKETSPDALFAQARAAYESGEHKKVPVVMYAQVCKDQPVQIAVRDDQEHLALVEGPVPEQAVNVPLTPEKVEGQLSRTGGTPFACTKVVAKVEPELALPLSALNALRRQALEQLEAQRGAPPQRRSEAFHPGVRYENPKESPRFTVSLSSIDQLTDGLIAQQPERIYLPVALAAEHLDEVKHARSVGAQVAAVMPRISTDDERTALCAQLDTLKEAGMTEVLAGTLGGVLLGKERGFAVRGDYGLGAYNAQTLKELKRLGLASATASFELKFSQIRDLNKPMELELIGYGRLPLMITENCIIKNQDGSCHCDSTNHLVDRKGERFPVVKASGCRSEILNSKFLFLADKAKDYSKIGLWALRLMFTTESPDECLKILRAYRGQERYLPGEFTRGLYYRNVD